jgi:hypothetical protein
MYVAEVSPNISGPEVVDTRDCPFGGSIPLAQKLSELPEIKLISAYRPDGEAPLDPQVL